VLRSDGIETMKGWMGLYLSVLNNCSSACSQRAVIVRSPLQSRQWVDGSWVSGSNGSLFGWVTWVVGQCMLTHDPPLFKQPGKSQ